MELIGLVIFVVVVGGGCLIWSKAQMDGNARH